MSETVQANDGAQLPLNSIPQQFTYDGAFVSTINVQYAGSSYTQEFLNDGTNIIYVGGWVNQATPGNNQIMVSEAGVPMVTETTAILMISENSITGS